MLKIVYASELRKHIGKYHVEAPAVFERKSAWILLIILNAVLLTVMALGLRPQHLTQLLPQVKAFALTTTEKNPNILDMDDFNVGLKAFDPNKARKERLAYYISRQFSIAREAALTIVDNTFEASQKHRIDPMVMLAIIAQESRFNPISESSVGAKGLVQALPRAHPEKIDALHKREGNILDVADNIELGARIFAEYLKRFNGDKIKALQQYNGNLADVNANYANKVLAHLKRMQDSTS